MKPKIIVSLLGIWLAISSNCFSCIMCLKAAQFGTSPDDPNASDYGVPSAQWMALANADPSTNAAVKVQLELPKTNLPAAVTYTNGALIGFDVLAGYDITLAPELENNTNGVWADAKVNAMIPANIKAIDRREVTVDGFMIPAHLENGKVLEFLLSRNPPACCYGGVPRIHEWVNVRVKPPGVEWEQYNTVHAHGVLRVGAERMDGALTSIYRMDADKVEITPEH